MTKTKKEKQTEKQEKKLLKQKEKAQKRKDKIAAIKAYREERLNAFKSAKGIGENIGFIITYSGKSIVIIISVIIGFLIGHYNLIPALFKKFGIITEVIK